MGYLESAAIGILFNVCSYIMLNIFILGYLLVSGWTIQGSYFIQVLQERSLNLQMIKLACRKHKVSTFNHRHLLWLFPFVSIIDIISTIAHFHVIGVKNTLIHKIEMTSHELNRRLELATDH